MEERIIRELEQYGNMLETHFHDMMDIEFTVENDRLYITSGRVGRRATLANLKIVIHMFCEGKIGINDVFQKISYQQIISFLYTKVIVNEHKLELLGKGLPASSGVASATVCYTVLEAEKFIGKNKEFIFCQFELSPDAVEIVTSEYCIGVITARGGVTSHAAVICRGAHKPCVAGLGDFHKIKDSADLHNNELTINGNNGSIYAGSGVIEKKNDDFAEIKILRELLLLVIKYNIVIPEICPLVWRMWDVIERNKRYGRDNSKRLVIKRNKEYISFVNPEKSEI